MKELGDLYKVLGVAEQPIKEYCGRTVYYWFEVFRRASATDLRNGCWFITIDVYEPNYSCPIEVRSAYTLHKVKVVECDLTMLIKHFNSNVETAILEILEVESNIEAISLKTTLCNYAEAPDYDELLELYLNVVRLVEKRDPRSTPLWVPVDELIRVKGGL